VERQPTVRVHACTSASALYTVLGRGPGVVVQVRALALASMFSDAMRDALGELPYQVAAAVAAPEILREFGVNGVQHGDVVVFTNGRIVGRVPREEPEPETRVVALLRASLSPWLGRAGQAQWDDDESDPFVVIGVPPSASFDEVHAAWRARLAEYHPDRFMRAGSKIRQVAEAESQRINVAFRRIAERFGRTTS
jgi:hypothetical protein